MRPHEASGRSRKALGFGRDALGFGRDALGFGREALGFGREALGRGREALGRGRDALGFGQETLGRGRQALGRRGPERARVRILGVPEAAAPPDGSVTTVQAAEVTLPRSELDRIWNKEHLERLAATYWRFLTRISFGALRILYTDEAREIVLLRRPLVLLRFRAPEYETATDGGTVTWRIDGGILVQPLGRGRGHLRLSVRRSAEEGGDDGDGLATGTVTSEVVGFHPLMAGSGRFARIGRGLYRITQLRVHVLLTHAFLRSLAKLDLAPSQVGALAAPTEGGAGVSPLARR